MSNANDPKGLYPIRHLCGGLISPNRYVLTAGATVFKGDVLKVVAAGTVEAAAAADGLIVVGVSAEYKVAPASGITHVLVYDDPYIIFGVQANLHSAAVAQTDVFATANHVVAAGSALTGLSGHQFNTSNLGTTGQLKIIGKIDAPDNDFGVHYVELAVIFNQHLYKAAVAGV